ncbi:dol-P-Man:Man(5)GlcNAc(2)-PP-Dol alpha-1,3-mannosyltransferase [Kwoniella heveanensis BCC8398]|uniref:Dol-P-Man:Man(5)GlcNAc(2)-PP-Dol alpha-1,3-mannosyltransferase n=1 Tax=Kwoniella heveanensis BCC8398 TaxID=1296120 RepID=A0A1B9GPE0_9TREE|nr:dol-P-Man:Man(5)GlcNAc(2)-PP-Dol alpha-1,3-mannosyltransferase [Kwoniella heveanensis BCC8398]
MPPSRASSSASGSSTQTKIKQTEHNRGIVGAVLDLVRSLLFERKHFWFLAGLICVGEALLSLLVIWKIPYTKIDWPAYMQQVQMFLDGERDYSKIEGETGPLVYPALHLYIYTAFHRFLPSIEDIRPAQYLFLIFYLLTFLAVSTIYYLAGYHYPQILLIPLALSKRAHSIFLLRLFNDPIAMLLFYASVTSFMLAAKAGERPNAGWRAGCALYSLALGVKMNILLFLPGLLVLLFQYRGVLGVVESAGIIGTIQLLLPLPYFLSSSKPYLNQAYFTSAFDFSRQFLYKWTVNWRFISEESFLSRERAVLLLAGHLGVVTLFAAFNWSPVPGGTLSVLKSGLKRWSKPAVDPTQLPANHIPLVLFTSNLIGMTFARSLHYQFQSWYFHQLPFLLFSGGSWNSVVIGIAEWLMIEYAWETFPATPLTSASLLVGHVLMLVGLFFTSSPSTFSRANGTGTVTVTGAQGKENMRRKIQ